MVLSRTATLISLDLIPGRSSESFILQVAPSDFFNLWKDADYDIPLLIQARKEYADGRVAVTDEELEARIQQQREATRWQAAAL